ncbi:hypothetical protein OA93_12315 [Flavobacterium sp. KMS]|uniref:hypothetical protein n=1 Tax=Flavobacterium sp. KMS TaxID=1566023 RepID=UPI00057DD951|nr:hypothetical protein [Flavobacterium sp. KMS]KIA97765.1 hypothetical protein OA93_12315 [Flavobacterium sp. KMS]
MKKIYWSNRWNTLADEIKFTFLISFSLIIIIEFGLGEFNAFNDFCYRFGQFILKLSYSFTAASIFYFLVQHMPKERKRIKLHGLLSYKIRNIEMQITYLIKDLLGDNELKTIKEISLIKCSNLLADLSVDKEINIDNMLIKGTYSNEEYFKLSIANTLNFCDEILEYNEYVDTKAIHRIAQIKSSCENITRLNIYHKTNNLRKYDFDFYNIIQHNLKLEEAIQSYSKNYYKESQALNTTYHKIKEGEQFEGDDIINN